MGEVDAAAASGVASRPDANAALAPYVARDRATGQRVFDTASWGTAVQANASWGTASWGTASWGTDLATADLNAGGYWMNWSR